MVVPRVPQRGNGPANDCGPADVVMMVGVTRPDLASMATVTDLSRRFDAPDDGTTPADLVRMGEYLGVSLRIDRAAGYPYIVLVDYEALPRENRSQATMSIPHYIVRLSDTEYHDSYWWTPEQVYRTAPKSVLDAAERNARTSLAKPVRVGFSVPPIAQQPMTQITRGKARIKSLSWNVRTAPTGSAATLTGAVLRRGATVDVIDVVRATDSATYTYAVVKARVGDQELARDNGAAWNLYLRTDGLEMVAPPVAAPAPGATLIGNHPALPRLTRGQKLGMHVFNNTDAALRWYTQGCRVFTVMDNVDLARRLRGMGCAVFYRRYDHHGSRISPTDKLNATGIGPGDELVLLGMNEGDIGVNGTRERFDWHVEWCNLIWARYPRCLPAVGGWAMGNPARFEDEAVAREWSALWTPFLNANKHRLALNYHSYDERYDERAPAGNPPRPVIGSDWLSRRFHKFGYARGLIDPGVVMISDEWGIDFGGGGGVAWAGYTNDDARRLLSPEVNNVIHESNVYAVTAYHGVQPHERREWAGYSWDGLMEAAGQHMRQ